MQLSNFSIGTQQVLEKVWW